MNADTARAIMPTGQGWEPYRSLTNDERYGQWAMQYFGCGHHRTRNDSTARKPQASDTAAKRQDGTLSDPLFPKPAPGSQFAEAGLFHPRYFFENTDPADLPDWHPDSHFCTSP